MGSLIASFLLHLYFLLSLELECSQMVDQEMFSFFME